VTIDTSDMSPEEAMQVRMFETMIDAMPTEGLELLVTVLQSKIEARKGG
jgi:hypothetical protein